MAPFGFHDRDRLAEPPLHNPVPGQALIVSGDPGYSGMNWWTAFLRLRVTVDGQEPSLVDFQCVATREKTPLTGMVLPVEVEQDDSRKVRIRWDEVPTIDELIARRDPLIIEPDDAWKAVIAAEPTRAEGKPAWGDGSLPGWPAREAIGRGRQAGTALVIGHSLDPAPYMAGGQFSPASRTPYRSGGPIETEWHTFLGWLLLCVIPQRGERYGLHLRTKVRRGRLGPVVPVSILSGKPDKVDILWDHAPEVPIRKLSAEEELEQGIAAGGQVLTGSNTDPGLAEIDNPLVRRMAARMAKKGAVVVVSSSETSQEQTTPGDDSQGP